MVWVFPPSSVSRKQKVSWQASGGLRFKMCFPEREKRDIRIHPGACKALYFAQHQDGSRNYRSGDRDINGLMGGEPYMSEAGSWSNTPVCGRWRQDMAVVFSFQLKEGGWRSCQL